MLSPSRVELRGGRFRKPIADCRKPSVARRPASYLRTLRISDFGFLSAFGFRPSDFGFRQSQSKSRRTLAAWFGLYTRRVDAQFRRGMAMVPDQPAGAAGRLTLEEFQQQVLVILAQFPTAVSPAPGGRVTSLVKAKWAWNLCARYQQSGVMTLS